jgi:hypothetical protein
VRRENKRKGRRNKKKKKKKKKEEEEKKIQNKAPYRAGRVLSSTDVAVIVSSHISQCRMRHAVTALHVRKLKALGNKKKQHKQ